MLSGTYKHTVDGKGRVFIPVKFRDELSETLYAYKGMDNCISVYSESEWAKCMERLEKTGYFTEMKFRRFFFAGVRELSVDTQGRTALPLDLRQKTKIDKDVTIIGMDDHIEIWNDDVLESDISSLDREAMEARLKELGL